MYTPKTRARSLVWSEPYSIWLNLAESSESWLLSPLSAPSFSFPQQKPDQAETD